MKNIEKLPAAIESKNLLLKTIVADLFLCCLTVFFCVGFMKYLEQCITPLEPKTIIDLSPFYLPKYAFFSFCRVFLALICSFFFSLAWGYWAAKDQIAEKFVIPLLDVLQSIPILGFLPGLLLWLVTLFPTSQVGIELVAILMIFTSQAWNMTFGVYHSIRTIPKEQVECSFAYRFSSWQKFKWVELPCSAISLVWNGMMSMAGSWFFLMLSEAFQLGNRDFRLPGIGSYMSVAASKGDVLSMCFAVIAMISLILILDQLFWRPLILWSQKFRFESISFQEKGSSWFSDALKLSWIVSKLCSFFSDHFTEKKRTRSLHLKKTGSFLLSRFFLLSLIGVLAFLCFFLFHSLTVVSFQEWMSLIHKLVLTFTRVLMSLGISLLLAVPIGLFIGHSEKRSLRIQSFLQIGASFPTPLLFPALLWFFHIFHVPLEIGSLVLMIGGTGWYILFNVIAGLNAIPSDLKEVAQSFRFPSFLALRKLYLPGIFPYALTGIVSAWGGASNTSIVAEYISYKGKVEMTPGIGSSISMAAEQGDIPLLTASVLAMVLIVALWNYQIWLRLYQYSEKRFSLNN